MFVSNARWLNKGRVSVRPSGLVEKPVLKTLSPAAVHLHGDASNKMKGEGTIQITCKKGTTGNDSLSKSRDPYMPQDATNPSEFAKLKSWWFAQFTPFLACAEAEISNTAVDYRKEPAYTNCLWAGNVRWSLQLHWKKGWQREMKLAIAMKVRCNKWRRERVNEWTNE